MNPAERWLDLRVQLNERRMSLAEYLRRPKHDHAVVIAMENECDRMSLAMLASLAAMEQDPVGSFDIGNGMGFRIERVKL